MERFKALLAGEKPDRVLVWLWAVTPGFAVQNVGYPIAAAYNDADKSYWSQVWTSDMFGDDGVPRMAVGGTYDVTWAFGGTLRWPAGEFEMAPLATRFPVTTAADAWALKLPEDVATAGPIPIYERFAELLDRHGDPISLFATSPIEGARSFCDMERLCRWFIKKPDLVNHLLQLAMDYSLAVIRHWAARFDPRRIIIYDAAPTASNQMISPYLFERFILDYQKTFHEKILETGIRHIFCHICGEQNLNLEYWTQIPMGDPGIVSFGHEVDIERAVDLFGDTCIIAGNIEPAVIQVGTHEQVYALSRAAIEKGKRARKGFILMPGCGLPPSAPPYNVFMMKKAVADHG